MIVRKKVPPVKGDEDHVGSTAVTKLIVEDSCKRASVRHSGRPSTYAAQLPTLLWVYVAALSRIGSYYWGAWTDQLSPLELVSIGRLQFVRLQCHPVSTSLPSVDQVLRGLEPCMVLLSHFVRWPICV